MRYIPSNRIKKGLFTKGGELRIKDTNTEYRGNYVEIFDGKYYTDETLLQELEAFSKNSTGYQNIPLENDGLLYNYTKGINEIYVKNLK